MRCCIHNCSSRLRDEASLVEDANIQALLRILDMVPDDFRVLAAAFEEDGNVEIDGIIEASSMGERSNSSNNIATTTTTTTTTTTASSTTTTTITSSKQQATSNKQGTKQSMKQ